MQFGELRRREFTALFGGTGIALWVAAASLANAQTAGKLPRVGLLTLNAPAQMAGRLAAFRGGMGELGYREGQNIILDIRFAEGRVDRLPALAAELVQANADVIVPAGYPAIRAVQQATSSIPIIVAIMSDPVEEGFAASYARPGGNLTGLAFQDAELTTKRLQILKEIVPSLSRIAVLWDRGMPPSLLKKTEEAARSLGLTLDVLAAADSAEIGKAFEAALEHKAQAVFQIASPRFSAMRTEIAASAMKKRIPSACEQREFVDAGCLVSYGPSFEAMYGRVPFYVDKVLRGAKAGDLPIEQPTKFDLVMNLKTARMLGLDISPMVLARADEVIE
jgi:putative ABC transport system substrate-binding protein